MLNLVKRSEIKPEAFRHNKWSISVNGWPIIVTFHAIIYIVFLNKKKTTKNQKPF